MRAESTGFLQNGAASRAAAQRGAAAAAAPASLILFLLVLMAAYLWNYNRMELGCVLAAFSGGELGSSKSAESWQLASSGNDVINREKQRLFIYSYSNAEWGYCRPHDDDKFMEFLEQTAADGWVESQFAYAHIIGGIRSEGYSERIIENMNKNLDADLSFDYLKKAADGGKAEAMHGISIAYALGKWGDVYFYNDDELEHKYAENTPNLYSRTDHYALGEWGEKSIAIEKNESLSLQLLMKAAELDRQELGSAALYDLARRYRYGLYGVKKDDAKAYDFFREAAELGSAEAKIELAGYSLIQETRQPE